MIGVIKNKKKKEEIMKYLFSLVVVILFGGCALLTPPPYQSSNVEFRVGPNGKPIVNYQRSVKGFANHDPGTVADDLAEAYYLAQSAQPGSAVSGAQSAPAPAAVNGEMRLVRVRNNSDYNVEILDGLFAGSVLSPGEYSRTSAWVKLGRLDLKIYWVNPRSGSYGTKVLHKIVTRRSRFVEINN